jgi:hypothetical protein
MPERVSASVTSRTSAGASTRTSRPTSRSLLVVDLHFVMQPQTVIADDDEGGLWAVPYSIKRRRHVGRPVEVRIQYVEKDSGKVAAEALRDRRAVFASAAESRPRPRSRGNQPTKEEA